jgi:RNA polymerase sigma factor (sigma-70 family)
MYSDAELREKVLAGDSEAVTHFYQTYRQRIFYTVLKALTPILDITEALNEAEDFAEDCITEFLYESLDRRTGKSKPSGISKYDPQRCPLHIYFLNVVFKSRLRTLLRYIRSKEFKFISLTGIEESDDTSSDVGYVLSFLVEIGIEFMPDKNLEEEELKNVISKVMNSKLDELCRDILYLQYVAGFSQKEISEKLAKRLGTVSSRRSRCLEQLRDFLVIELRKLSLYIKGGESGSG